jgi:poly(hydroxyalkanoate) depolymerase family esterase
MTLNSLPRWRTTLAPWRVLAAGLVLVAAGSANAGQWITGAYGELAHGSRNYRAWLPNGWAPGQHRPVVMVLHGCDSDPLAMANTTRFNELADREGFIALYPEEPTLLLTPGRCWGHYHTWNQQRNNGEPKLLVGMIGQLAVNVGIDLSRIYVAGHSAGGAMAAILAACYSDVFAAAMVHSGGQYKASNGLFNSLAALQNGSTLHPDEAGQQAWQCSLSPNRLMPTLVLHGGADSSVNPVNGVQAAQQAVQTNDLGDDGVDNQSAAFIPFSQVNMAPVVPGGRDWNVTTYRNSAGVTIVQHIVVNGMNHHWAGGSTANGGYGDPLAPNATQLAWDFFKTRQR